MKIKSTALLFSSLFAGGVMAGDIGPSQVLDLVEGNEIKDPREMDKAILELHPQARITDAELEDHYGKYVYKVELRDNANVEWEVSLDAKSGAVLENRQDDD